MVATIRRREFLERTGKAVIGVPLVWIAGCDGKDAAAGVKSDGGAKDAAVLRDARVDTGAGDAGPADAGPADAGPVDAGPVDAAQMDTGVVDPEMPDDSLEALAKSLQGSIVARRDATYDQDRLLFNTRFDGLRPALIAFCETSADVQKTIAWARRHQLEIAARSGGHSYAGYSTGSGVVIDLRRMAKLDIDLSAQTITVGSGAVLIDVYAALWAEGLTIAAGSCPTLGMAGHTLGGGYGLISRKFGTASDNLLALELVTAAGDILSCSAAANDDLFWACRGGGGGNFGVVTSLTLQAHPVSMAAYFTFTWDWPDASAVVAAWQAWAPNAPDELTALCQLSVVGGGSPRVSVSGQYLGAVEDLTALLTPIADVGTPTSMVIDQDSCENLILMWADCYGTVPECHLQSQDPEGKLTRSTYRAKSDYVTTPLPTAGIQALMAWIEARQQSDGAGFGGILLDSYGGALNRVAADATAFVHRDRLFSIQYIASERPADSRAVLEANLAWINGVHAAMRPYVSGYAYQNYIDADLTDWQHAYYGANWSRLVSVKAKYDPDDVFRFAQSIPPA